MRFSASKGINFPPPFLSSAGSISAQHLYTFAASFSYQRGNWKESRHLLENFIPSPYRSSAAGTTQRNSKQDTHTHTHSLTDTDTDLPSPEPQPTNQQARKQMKTHNTILEADEKLVGSSTSGNLRSTFPSHPKRHQEDIPNDGMKKKYHPP